MNVFAVYATRCGRRRWIALDTPSCQSHGHHFLLDTEREYHSLVNLLPHGIIATANRCPSGYDILHKGLQVVVNLRSWATDEAAALAVVQLVGELFTTAMSQAPQERVHCIVHLDEAGYWIPQDAV